MSSKTLDTGSNLANRIETKQQQQSYMYIGLPPFQNSFISFIKI